MRIILFKYLFQFCHCTYKNQIKLYLYIYIHVDVPGKKKFNISSLYQMLLDLIFLGFQNYQVFCEDL